jgi:hypothetical protein
MTARFPPRVSPSAACGADESEPQANGWEHINQAWVESVRRRAMR